METVIEEGNKFALIPVEELEIGEIGEVQDSDVEFHNGTILLRYFDGYLSLNDPSRNWGMGTPLKVRRINNATVTLTFGTGSK